MGRRNVPVQNFSAKDAKHHMTQADYYRHQIGRQESKKQMKQESKQRRRKESEQVQKKGAFGYFGKILIIMMLILSALYLAAYYIAQRDDKFWQSVPKLEFLKPVSDYLGKQYQIWVKPYLPF